MRPDTKIALTLFTVSKHCKTESDLDRTLGRVREIGYESVQVSGIPDVTPQNIKKLLDAHGLYCCATHESLDRIVNHSDEVLETMDILGAPFTALGSPGKEYWVEGGAKRLADMMNPVAIKFEKTGKRLGYHNHQEEFWKFQGKTFLQEYFDLTDKSLHMELDLHWVQRGGADPTEWLYKSNGRSSVIHFKDFLLVHNEEGKPKPAFAEIGEGQLNWTSIIDACVKTNVQWYVVEQDRRFEGRDIFESIEISFNNMKKMGIK